jgi:hypothetical protein
MSFHIEEKIKNRMPTIAKSGVLKNLNSRHGGYSPERFLLPLSDAVADTNFRTNRNEACNTTPMSRVPY